MLYFSLRLGELPSVARRGFPLSRLFICMHILYVDESGDGGIQAVLNVNGEVVARNVPGDPYGGEENDLAVDVTRGPSGGLDQRSLATQKAFLIGIKNADERNFRKIEPFAEQVDADQNIEVSRA